MGFEEWLDNAIKHGASEEQIRTSLTQSGYPEEHIRKSLLYRTEYLSAKHHKQLGYLLVGAGVIVALIAIVLFFFA